MKTLWKKRASVGAKFFLDALALVSFAFVSSTGFVLYFILPHGSGHMESLGALRRGVKMLWGMDRREWGDVHLIVSLVLLAVLFLHVIQHWKWVKGFFMNKMAATHRIALLTFLLLVTLVSFAPFMTPTTTYTPDQAEAQPRGRGNGGGGRSRTAQSKPPSQESKKDASRKRSLDLRGKDSIATVAKKMAIDPMQVKQLLGLPETIADDTRMSAVKTRRNASMSDLRKKLSTDQ